MKQKCRKTPRIHQHPKNLAFAIFQLQLQLSNPTNPHKFPAKSYCQRHGRRSKTQPRTLARYYDPPTGQFTSMDPQYLSTYQAYSYANGNPVSGSDPSGEGGCGFLWLFSCGHGGNSKFTVAHILGTGKSVKVFTPFYNYVTGSGNFNLDTAFRKLWFGLYQPGGINGKIIDAGSSSWNTYKDLYQYALPLSGANTATFTAQFPCSQELNFINMECVSVVILGAEENPVGGYTGEAESMFYQSKEYSMAWFAAYSNHNLIGIANQAMSVLRRVYLKEFRTVGDISVHCSSDLVV